MSITDDVEDFIRLHRAHGQLVGDATEPTLTGSHVTITCQCGVTFVRHVTAGEAVVDLVCWRGGIDGGETVGRPHNTLAPLGAASQLVAGATVSPEGRG